MREAPPFLTTYYPEDGLLRTRLSGLLRADDVDAWRDGLNRTAAAIPTPFRMLVDIRGYEVAEQDPSVHRTQREVVPLFLAAHGFRPAFFDLFEAEPPPPTDGAARCLAVAHVHHDAAKMAGYTERLGRAAERFFTDPGEAEAWLHALDRPQRPC
jgi:hypothetical protein